VVDTKNDNNNKNKKIMIIDDDKDITNLFSIFLEYNGYIVNAYINPLEAINNFRKNSYDLIILDLKMPLLKDLKNKFNLLLSQQEVNNKSTMMIL
jgi:DNA-binding response OmpR family regulator